MSEAKIGGLSLSSQIAIALGLGVALGVFLGEPAGALSVVADGYIKLLQMTVLPYVTVSLISGLGSLQYAQAKILFVKVGGLLLLLWALTLVLVFLMPLSFPNWEAASFFSSALVQPRQEFDFISLYIPSNPFYSLANNIVPAVVLFSALIGIALMGIENKGALIDVLNILNRALSAATRFVVRLTPIGVFAIAANASGTMSVEEFGRIQVFLISYVAMALLISFWLLPGLVTALTSIPHREILVATKDALMTAFVTGNLFIVLPILSETSKTLLRKHDLITEDDNTTDIIVPASFNFPHTGKILSLSFILFAGWFANAEVPIEQYPTFAATGLMSFFGSLNVAVPFLLDLFQIPADMFELFVATGVINARFGTLVAASHIVVLAVAGTCAATGAIVWDARRLIRFAIVSLAATAVTIGGLRFYFTTMLDQEYHRDQVVTGMHLLRERVDATVYREEPELSTEDDPARARLAQILDQGVLRVGYFPDSLPYAYFNRDEQLVGLDVEMAHILADELGVSLQFVPMARSRLNEQLHAVYCDVIMSGFPVTTPRAAAMTFSQPYLHETLGFLVRDHRRRDFVTRDAILAQTSLLVAIPAVDYIRVLAQSFLPDSAEVELADNLFDFFEADMSDVDAIAMTAERGAAWSLLYPRYSVVVPQPNVIRLPLAYPVARGDQDLADFLTTWIELKKSDGTIDRLYDYWILGQDAEPRTPRWSIIRDVLHWVE